MREPASNELKIDCEHDPYENNTGFDLISYSCQPIRQKRGVNWRLCFQKLLLDA